MGKQSEVRSQNSRSQKWTLRVRQHVCEDTETIKKGAAETYPHTTTVSTSIPYFKEAHFPKGGSFSDTVWFVLRL